MAHYDDILATLERQLQLNQELLIVSKEKYNILKENNIHAMMEITQAEEKLARQVINEEKKRDMLLNALKSQGKDIQHIADIIHEASTELSDQIQSVAGRLRSVLEELQVQNEMNEMVLSVTLDQIEFAKNVLTSDYAPTTYGKKSDKYGAENQNIDRAFFEDKY